MFLKKDSINSITSMLSKDITITGDITGFDETLSMDCNFTGSKISKREVVSSDENKSKFNVILKSNSLVRCDTIEVDSISIYGSLECKSCTANEHLVIGSTAEVSNCVFTAKSIKIEPNAKITNCVFSNALGSLEKPTIVTTYAAASV